MSSCPLPIHMSKLATFLLLIYFSAMAAKFGQDEPTSCAKSDPETNGSEVSKPLANR